MFLKENKRIIRIIIDNFSSHKAKAVQKEAEKLGIHFVFFTPYSPDLNPIEFVWKSLKKLISEVFIGSVEDLRRFIKEEIPQSIQNHEYFNLKSIVGQPLHCGAERLGLINSS